MAAFAKALPSLLAKTHVVLEVRDVRLPLTSINSLLEATLAEWRHERDKRGEVRERIVVYTKRDLVPSWGEEVSNRCLALYLTRILIISLLSVFDEHCQHNSSTIYISLPLLLCLPFAPYIPLSYVRLLVSRSK